MQHRLSKHAEADLRRLYHRSIVEFGAAHAERYYGRLADALKTVGEFPGAHPERPELGGVRVKPFEAHYIIYRVRRDDVFILRILHGRQEIARHLRG